MCPLMTFLVHIAGRNILPVFVLACMSVCVCGLFFLGMLHKIAGKKEEGRCTRQNRKWDVIIITRASNKISYPLHKNFFWLVLVACNK